MSRRGFGRRHMKRIELREAQHAKYPGSLGVLRLKRKANGARSHQCQNLASSRRVRDGPDLCFYRIAPDQLPLTTCNGSQDSPNRFGLCPDARLGLIVEQPIEAATVEVDSNHTPEDTEKYAEEQPHFGAHRMRQLYDAE